MDYKELVELITDYLEHSLGKGERTRFEQHLSTCPGCQNYLDQMRLTIETLGKIEKTPIPDEAKTALVAAFQDWNRDG